MGFEKPAGSPRTHGAQGACSCGNNVLHLLVLKTPARRRMGWACCNSDKMALRHIEVGVGGARAWHSHAWHPNVAWEVRPLKVARGRSRFTFLA